MQDHKSLAAEMIAEEPHRWTKERNKLPLPESCMVKKKPLLERSRVLTPIGMVFVFFVLVAIGSAAGCWTIQAILSL